MMSTRPAMSRSAAYSVIKPNTHIITAFSSSFNHPLLFFQIDDHAFLLSDDGRQNHQ